MRARQRIWTCWTAGLVAAVVAVCAGPALHASVVVPLSLTQLVEAADIVVDGTVDEVRSIEGPEGLERMVLVRVTAAWKGTVDGPVYVRLAGGRMGRTETRVTGVPRVEPGDRLVWFLARHPRGGYAVLGLHQGALRTLSGSDDVTRVLAPARVAGGRGDVSRAPRLLQDLATEVRAIAAAEDGK